MIWELHGKEYYAKKGNKEYLVRTVKNKGWGLFERYVGDSRWTQQGVYLHAVTAKESAV